MVGRAGSPICIADQPKVVVVLVVSFDISPAFHCPVCLKDVWCVMFENSPVLPQEYIIA